MSYFWRLRCHVYEVPSIIHLLPNDYPRSKNKLYPAKYA